MIAVADAVSLPFRDNTFDMVMGSPPYTDCRDYGIGACRSTAEWVTWMLVVTTECLRVSRGAVVWVAAGPTRDRNYQPACEGLMWKWFKQGGSMYRPCFWHRVGIPGSGGDQWFRHDVEQVMCFKRPGMLQWTDNTAMGHPPKWAAGGEMSHRLSDGQRRNQWGGRPGESGSRQQNGQRGKAARPSHTLTKRLANGDMEEQDYVPPVLANPGNLIEIPVGGGMLGSKLSHENEAPFPEKLAEWFVLSLCPPGGTVLDPFSGSGTTAAVAKRYGRRFVATDIRESQCDLTRRRVAQTQAELFV